MRKFGIWMLLVAALTLGVAPQVDAADHATSQTIVVRGHNVTVRGCHIDGADRGIIVTGTARHVLIEDCLIENTGRSGIVVWGGADDVKISNVTIVNPGLDGITAYDHLTRNLKVSNVDIRGAANHGAHLGGTNLAVLNLTSAGHRHAGLMVANHTDRPLVDSVTITNLITSGGRWGLWLRRARQVDLGPMVVNEGRTLIQDCMDVRGRAC